ncbi:MAG TPA: hypothetical protein VGK73_09745 [Polyangiaceae bacterium]
MATGSARYGGIAGPAVVPSPDVRSPLTATSGVRPATRSDTETLTSALVEIRTGRLLEELPEHPGALPLAEIAAALPEIFGTQPVTKSRILGEIRGGSLDLQDLVLISPRCVHVLQKLPNAPNAALVSVAGRDASVGWIVSEARSRLERA